MTAVDKEWKKRLVAARKLSGLTMAEVAKRIGVTKPTLLAWNYSTNTRVGIAATSFIQEMEAKACPCCHGTGLKPEVEYDSGKILP